MKSLADELGTAAKREAPSYPEPPTEPLSGKYTAKHFCLAIVNSAEYRASIMQRIVLGTLSPQIEQMLWDRAAGKVVEKVEVKDTTRPYQHLSLADLRQQLIDELALLDQLRTNDEVDSPASDADDGPSSSSVH